METKKDVPKGLVGRLTGWFWHDFLGIVKEMRIDYLPPLMIFFAAGISAFTSIVESFFIKDTLGLSAAFLAGLAFWAGLPWALKMPLGHLVDIFWHRKSWFVYFGATLMAASLVIMIGLTGYTDMMRKYLTLDTWYVLSTILSSLGFVFQNVVADAMTVEAVPNFRPDGSPFSKIELQKMHTTMQTLGRIATVGGGAVVAGAGGWLARTLSYKVMYEIALIIPLLSITGVILGKFILSQRRKKLHQRGFSQFEIDRMMSTEVETTTTNWPILIGSAILVIIVIAIGFSKIVFKEELVFLISLGVLIFLIAELIRDVDSKKRWEIISIAVIVFVFRATPDFGAGATWWQIDVLHFDESFYGSIRQMAAVLAILGMLALRGWIAKRPLPYLVVFLSIFSTIALAPYIGMYYGLHHWTETHLGFGAKTITVADTAAGSPLGEVAMIPMLVWIAKEAPKHKKATYFAVFAAFSNLALSASSLFTQYMNNIFPVTRGDYHNLGTLMISVTLIGLILPILAVIIFRPKTISRK